MKSKLKIALLALLGFSTASCASKKAAKKSMDRDSQSIETDNIDTRIMLMYGVPGPDGNRIMTEEEVREGVSAAQDAATVKPDSLDLRPALMYGVRFPDGSTERPKSGDATDEKLVEGEAERAASEE